MLKKMALGTAGLLACGHAVAQGTGGYSAGPLRVAPSVTVEYFYDDNVLRDSTASQSSSGLSVRPDFGITFGGATGDRIRVSYSLDAGLFEFDSDEDYFNHTLKASADVVRTNRFHLQGFVTYLDQRDDREATDIPQSSERDEWHSWGYGAKAVYGAPGAKGRLIGEVSRIDKEYDNNPATTTGFDTEQTRVSGAFAWRIMPKTDLIAEIRHTEINYPDALNDNEQWFYLLGAEWEATSKTTGSFRAGWSKKDFDEDVVAGVALKNQTEAHWELDVVWRPLTYSTVTIGSRHELLDGQGEGNTVVKKTFGATWGHQWKERFSTDVNVTLTASDWKETNVDRNDDTFEFGVGLSYQMRRWLSIGARYKYTDNDSDKAGENYKVNYVGVNLKASL